LRTKERYGLTLAGAILSLGLALVVPLDSWTQESQRDRRARTDRVQEDRRGDDRVRQGKVKRDEVSRERGSGRQDSDTRSAQEGLQRVNPPRQGEERHSQQNYKGIFSSVQQGLSVGNITSFSQHFGPQVSVNLRGGESGSYSANQAYYVLENYLRTRKVLYVDFTTLGESESNPYATGSAGFSVKGNRELLQVYVSLSYLEDRWVITQINIY